MKLLEFNSLWSLNEEINNYDVVVLEGNKHDDNAPLMPVIAVEVTENDQEEPRIIITCEPNPKTIVLHEEFENEDKVFIDNSDGSTDYFQLIYDKEMGACMLIPFTDKTFNTPKKVKGKVKAEFVYALGWDLLNRCSDYDFEDLK